MFKRHPLIVTGAALACIFAVVMLSQGGDLANVGYLVIGALIASAAGLVADTIRRPTQAQDLAQALFVELADRVARCCFDFEAPWRAYLDRNAALSANVDSFRLRKFAPHEPVIYLASAAQLGLLREGAAPALIHFYYRLAAWQRDLENIAAEAEGGQVTSGAIVLLAKRAKQTLHPGLRALEALSPMVDNPQQIEAVAIAGYDEFVSGHPSDRPLRERIAALLESG